MPKKKPERKWVNGVRPTSNGRFEWCRKIGVNDDGSAKMAYGTCDTRPEAEIERAKASELTAAYNPKMTIATWGEAWHAERKSIVKVTGQNADEINERENRTLDESSYENEKYTLALIKAAFSDDLLGYTSTERIEKGIMDTLKPVYRRDESGACVTDAHGNRIVEKYVRYAFGYYQKMRGMLVQMYNRAEVKKIITHEQNPMYLMQDLKDPRRKKKTTDSFETVEVQAIIDFVESNDLLVKDSERRWLYALAVGIVAGYREQEAVPLLETDIEPDGSAIQINKASKRGTRARMYLGDPKSEAGERLIELPELVWKYAKWLRAHSEKGYVFYSAKTARQSERLGLKGNDFICWIHPSTYAYNVKKILAQISGIKQLNVHQAQRHTKITLDNDAGVDRRVGMSQSGHSDEKVYTGYDHVHRGVKKIAAAKVNTLLSTRPEENSDYSI